MKKDDKVYYKIVSNPCPNPHYDPGEDNPYFLSDEAYDNITEKHCAFWDVCIKDGGRFELPPYPTLSYLDYNERFFGSYITEDELEELRCCERQFGGDPDTIQAIYIK
jgi:hypothetical protein